MNCLQSRIPSESLPYTHCSFVICYCTSCFIPSTYESLLYAHCSFVLSYCTSYESLPCARCFLVLYYHPSSFRTSCEQRRLCRCVNPQRQVFPTVLPTNPTHPLRALPELGTTVPGRFCGWLRDADVRACRACRVRTCAQLRGCRL